MPRMTELELELMFALEEARDWIVRSGAEYPSSICGEIDPALSMAGEALQSHLGTAERILHHTETGYQMRQHKQAEKRAKREAEDA